MGDKGRFRPISMKGHTLEPSLVTPPFAAAQQGALNRRVWEQTLAADHFVPFFWGGGGRGGSFFGKIRRT